MTVACLMLHPWSKCPVLLEESTEFDLAGPSPYKDLILYLGFHLNKTCKSDDTLPMSFIFSGIQKSSPKVPLTYHPSALGIARLTTTTRTATAARMKMKQKCCSVAQKLTRVSNRFLNPGFLHPRKLT